MHFPKTEYEIYRFMHSLAGKAKQTQPIIISYQIEQPNNSAVSVRVVYHHSCDTTSKHMITLSYIISLNYYRCGCVSCPMSVSEYVLHCLKFWTRTSSSTQIFFYHKNANTPFHQVRIIITVRICYIISLRIHYDVIS